MPVGYFDISGIVVTTSVVEPGNTFWTVFEAREIVRVPYRIVP
jgi:hypothetical protein